jgi:hemoglobin-like flavoprotein
MQPATPTTASTQPTRRQRIATFNAAHARSIFPIAAAFADRFAGAFPPSRGMFRLSTKTERHEFACAVADLCKNIEELGTSWPALGAIGRTLASRGFSTADISAARMCFLASIREHAGDDWNAQIEQDWSHTADRLIECMKLPRSSRAPMRIAA